MISEDDPFWGMMNEIPMDDSAAMAMNEFIDTGDGLIGTVFAAPGSSSAMPPASILMEPHRKYGNISTNDNKVFDIMLSKQYLNPTFTNQEQPGAGEGQQIVVIENELEKFATSISNAYEFRIIESEKKKSKPYKVEKKNIFLKLAEALRIEVVGAQTGQTVKLSMRYKKITHYQQPVVACLNHRDSNKKQAGSTFHVVVKESPVYYTKEEGHHTAHMFVPNLQQGEPFSFSPVFCCRNSCNPKFGKCQEMILSLCDANMELLHMDKFDLRVCENVGRDSKINHLEKVAKKPKRNCRIKTEFEEPDQQTAGAVALPSPRTQHYLVEADDELYLYLDALVKVRNKKLIKVDEATIQKILDLSASC